MSTVPSHPLFIINEIGNTVEVITAMPPDRGAYADPSDLAEGIARVDTVQVDVTLKYDEMVALGTGLHDGVAAAEAARDLARDWAEKTEDLEVVPGFYSSHHWAQKSEDSAIASEASRQVSDTRASDANTSAIASEASRQASDASAAAAATSEANAATSETNAATSESNAATSETNAATSESNAASSATAAQTSATASETSRQASDASALAASDSESAALASENKAQQWAEELEDVPVAPGEYSAHHWANKSQDSATASESSRQVSDSRATDSSNSATASENSRQASDASAAAALASETAAQTAQAKAEDWAEGAEDVEVETGKYSAKHHALKAEDQAILADQRATAAQNSATASESSRQASDASATAASNSEAAAATSEALAHDWAQKGQNLEVTTGEYSAYHWAKYAEERAAGVLNYRGSHDASTGAPASPATGDFYKISVAGSFGGHTFAVGDSAIYNGSGWDKIDNTEQVTSVAGKNGAVTLVAADVTDFTAAVQSVGDPRYLGINAKAADSELLDNLDSGQFVRSDVDDAVSGVLAFNNFNGGVLLQNSVDPTRELMIGQHGGSAQFLRFVPKVSGAAQFTKELAYDFVNEEWVVDGGFRSYDDLNIDTQGYIAGNRILTVADEGTLDAGTVDGIDSSQFLRSDVDDIIAASYNVVSGKYHRFGHANELDANDGKIGARLFGAGLNIIGTQTEAGGNREIRLWGDVVTDVGEFFYHDGYHPTADRWTTARTLSLTGDASGSTAWDGSGNASINVTVADDSHVHDSRYYTISTADGRFHRHLGNVVNEDWNTFVDGTENGYRSVLNAGGANRPGAYMYGTLVSWATAGQGKFQLYAPHNGSDGQDSLWYRSGWNTDYDNWTRIITLADRGSGKGFDADLLDGAHGNGSFNDFSGNQYVRRHANGYIWSNYFNMSADDVGTQTPTRVPVEVSTDGYLRWQTLANFRDRLEVGFNADTVDGLHASSFALTSGTYSGLRAQATTKADVGLGSVGDYASAIASTGSTHALRDSSGDIHARLFRSEFDSTNATVNFIMTQIDTASNNYIRPTTPAQFRAAVTDGYYLGASAKAADSNLLDGLDNSFFRNASNLNAGTLPAARFNDTAHGNRGGGSLHSVATTGANGFMSAADKAKLDAVQTGSTVESWALLTASSVNAAQLEFNLSNLTMPNGLKPSRLKVVLTGIAPATGSDDFHLQFQSASRSYAAGTTDYHLSLSGSNGNGHIHGADGNTWAFNVNGDLAPPSYLNPASFEFTFDNPYVTNARKTYRVICAYSQAGPGGTWAQFTGTGIWVGGDLHEALTHMRFYHAGGSALIANYELWGIN